MNKQMTVCYYYHSGFSVASGDVLLVFDYWRAKPDRFPEALGITPEVLARFNEVYVFISHEHEDHFDGVVYTWDQYAPVTYVIADTLPEKARGLRMKKGDETVFSDRVKVKAYGSTDSGVSFLVTLDGLRFFHAGDLNFWHWREESTVKEIEEAEEAFRSAVEPIMKEEIDLAFFPVDPRQGRLFDAGANYFILSVKPRLLIPMHFWGRAEIAVEFARRSRCRQTEVIALTRPGEKLRLEMDEQGYMTVHLLSVAEAVPARGAAKEMPVQESVRQEVDLDSYDGSDPFSETDLPVKLDDD